MLDLSVLAPPAKIEPWYDIHSKDLKALDPHLRDAHIRSMVFSQKKDYGADLRYIVTEDDVNTMEIDPDRPRLGDFAIPELAKQLCAEVVYRSITWSHGQEFVLASKNGEADIWRKAGAVQPVAPPAAPTTSEPQPKGTRTLDW